MAISVRQTLWAWVQQHTDGMEKVSEYQVCKEAAKHFSQDKAFCEAVLQQYFGALIFDILHRLFKGNGVSMDKKGRLTFSTSKLQAKYRDFRMPVGDGGMLVLKMTADDWLASAAYHENQINALAARRDWCIAMAQALSGGGCSEDLGLEKIEELYQRAHADRWGEEGLSLK